MLSERKSFDLELVPDSDSLYIFFGGISAGISMPPFEFYNASKILTHNKVFFRDFRQAWYQSGMPGVGEDLRSVVSFMSKMIADISPSNVFLIGNSMGGYAAMMFSELLGTGSVVAFAPQTFIEPQLRDSHGDSRWSAQLTKVYRSVSAKDFIFDLRQLMMKKSRPGRNVSIYVSSDDRLDMAHAKYLDGVEGVFVHTISGGGHDVVKLLKQRGKLPEIMAGEFGGVCED
ncbi:alpha/beta fold hydrolase [Microbulbifer elongatus]|uniref:alpha/beta fold hydrolase n=1 Tax=Microbulbifer elongatus TaxID=86173 RepID=UPI001CFEF102|nr:YqiA/YcfP family alpha/beta fold hydrolase [Microbulbifer elongatus]